MFIFGEEDNHSQDNSHPSKLSGSQSFKSGSIVDENMQMTMSSIQDYQQIGYEAPSLLAGHVETSVTLPMHVKSIYIKPATVLPSD